MARVAVVAYPVLDEAALDWIEKIRARHDPQASRIRPHFTLVFPIDASPVDVKNELARVAPRHQPIPLVIRSAKFVPDLVHGGGHVFLVPDEGRDRIARLHGDLYSGVLRLHLREDIAFVPHVTIAADNDVRWCEDYAQQLNRTLQAVRGVIDSITLVDVTAIKIESLDRFALQAPPSPLGGSC